MSLGFDESREGSMNAKKKIENNKGNRKIERTSLDLCESIRVNDGLDYVSIVS